VGERIIGNSQEASASDTDRGTVSKYDWMDEALCREIGPEVFFPTTTTADTTRQAKSICNRCEVQIECLNYGLDNLDIESVLGGYSQNERRLIKRKKGKWTESLEARINRDT